ncbi:programmed cell death 2 like trus [Rhynchophorus ferrugineus]|uniref:programmed cell death 2 like trus n=1 Tax=Rhynchophorus ferrugineus TaxID=354439 RepID=UPI003FCE7BFD
MANFQPKVLLGFPDELITEKHKVQLNYTVNKIGGEPDLPSNFPKIDQQIACNLCQLPTKLIVQIYAPVEGTLYHRTLYLFACINPNCWNRNESWKCFCLQIEDNTTKQIESSVSSSFKLETTDWCTDADDWGDDNNANFPEENCNIINNGNGKESDDEESGSLDDSLRSNLGNLCIDDRNANNGAYGGAVGRQHSPGATAEIEGNEGEVISVETPVVPKTNLVALLNEVTPLPQSEHRRSNDLPFVSYFMSVWEEDENCIYDVGNDSHIKELLLTYQQKNGDINSPQRHQRKSNITASIEGDFDLANEEYEQGKPHHGDLLFHHFISKIQTNPGQILRYNRGGKPLLLQPLQESAKHCRHCQGELVFEFQLISTIISKLWLACDSKQQTRLEFGTVLVYTCKRNCWASNDSFKEEVVLVQKEIY